MTCFVQLGADQNKVLFFHNQTSIEVQASDQLGLFGVHLSTRRAKNRKQQRKTISNAREKMLVDLQVLYTCVQFVLFSRDGLEKDCNLIKFTKVHQKILMFHHVSLMSCNVCSSVST